MSTPAAGPQWQGLIDDFNRPNALLDAGAGAPIWVRGWIDSDWPTDLRVISNQLGQTVNAWNQAYVRPAFRQLRSDFDVLIDCVTAPSATNSGEFHLHMLLQNPGTQRTGLAFIRSGTSWILRRAVNGANTQLASASGASIASGTTFWVAKRGNALTAYRRTSPGGAWAQIITAANVGSPATGWTTGAVGIEIAESASRWDNLRGGPFVGGAALKCWTGAAWQPGTLRGRAGSAWVTARVHDGTRWRPAERVTPP
jgi:hypothetical protein